MANRRFPPPWSVEDIGAAFVVKDSTGQKLAYVYFDDELGRRSGAANKKRPFYLRASAAADRPARRSEVSAMRTIICLLAGS